MADRIVEDAVENVPEIPELVERVLLTALDEGKQKMLQAGEVCPFTMLVVKDNLFIETHPGEGPEQCFAAARHTVEGARGGDAYAFCYDGYVETDDGNKDVLIAEGGLPGERIAYAVGYVYEYDADGKPVFEEDAAYIGEAPNFMEKLKEALEYDVSEIDTRYLEGDEPEL